MVGLYRRGKTWYGRFKDHDGREVRRSLGTHEKSEARRKARAIQTQIDSEGGGVLSQGRVTFESVLDSWLSGEAKNLKDHKGLEIRARRVKVFASGPILSAPERANRMKDIMLRDGLKPATVNRHLSIVRKVCNLAFERGLITTPVGMRVKLLQENNERHVYLTKEQIETLARCAEGEAGLAIRLLAYTGLRCGELFALTKSDFVDGVFLLSPSITKGTKPRAVPAPSWFRPDMLPLKLSRHQFRRAFERARVEAGLPDLHIHDLRHTFASLLALGGANLSAICAILGHSDLSITGRYAHLTDTHLRDVAKIAEHGNG